MSPIHLVVPILLAALVASCSRGPAPVDSLPPAETRTAEERARLDHDYRELVDGYNRETGARQVSVAEVRSLLDTGASVVVLDVREPAEQAVSTLPGARRLSPATAVDHAEELRDVPRDTPIVTYCTAGYRSGLAAVDLEERLGRPVLNLDGGIVAWFNAGGPLVDANGEAVAKIHPYGDEWARFVHAREVGE